MRIKELFDQQTLRALLGYILLLPIFLVSGCAYSPFLVPEHAADKVGKPVKRVFAARLGVTVNQTVQPDERAVKFVFLKKGDTIWGEKPGNTADKWRFALYGPGKAGETTICEQDWSKEPSQASDRIEVACIFKDPEQLASYFGQPLRIVLDFRLAGESTSQFTDTDRVVESSVYLHSDSKKCCPEMDAEHTSMDVK